MNALLRKLKSRLPDKGAIIPVFSTLLFFVASWAVYRALWWLPSWLDYLNLWDVSIVLAYTLAYALLESAMLTGVFLLLALILPEHFFKEQFLSQGAALAGLFSLGALLVQRRIGVIFDLALVALIAAPLLILAGGLFLILATAYLFRRFPRLRIFIEGLAERMTIFAYLYIPLGLIGVGVVIVRNLP